MLRRQNRQDLVMDGLLMGDELREEAREEARSGSRGCLAGGAPLRRDPRGGAGLGGGSLVLDVVVQKLKPIGTQRKETLLSRRRQKDSQKRRK